MYAMYVSLCGTSKPGTSPPSTFVSHGLPHTLRYHHLNTRHSPPLQCHVESIENHSMYITSYPRNQCRKRRAISSSAGDRNLPSLETNRERVNSSPLSTNTNEVDQSSRQLQASDQKHSIVMQVNVYMYVHSYALSLTHSVTESPSLPFIPPSPSFYFFLHFSLSLSSLHSALSLPSLHFSLSLPPSLPLSLTVCVYVAANHQTNYHWRPRYITTTSGGWPLQSSQTEKEIHTEYFW